MEQVSYRPAVGQKIFVSLYRGKPFLVDVAGYHFDERFSSELIDYVRNGKSDFSLLKEAVFYPDVSADSKFIYVVMCEDHDFMEKSNFSELGFFFDPQTAFNHIDDITSGKVESCNPAHREFVELYVQVEKL